jgi:hypothetical protein
MRSDMATYGMCLLVFCSAWLQSLSMLIADISLCWRKVLVHHYVYIPFVVLYFDLQATSHLTLSLKIYKHCLPGRRDDIVTNYGLNEVNVQTDMRER